MNTVSFKRMADGIDEGTTLELRDLGGVSSSGYVRRVFLFETLGITAQNWRERAEDGDEIGVRVEIQCLEEGPGRQEFDAVELRLHDPIFRADLFTLSTGRSGNFDRAHYHDSFTDREPGPRHFEPELTKDPMGWLEAKLSNLDRLLELAGRAELAHGGDSGRVALAVPSILDTVTELFDAVGVATGEREP